MVKSRQVGKPAKLAASGRKLVRAYTDKTTLEDNECMKVCKELCYGLAIFNATFGCDDNHESQFHGFSPHEIRLATDKSAIRTNQVEKEHRARGVLFTPYTVGRSALLPVSSLMKSRKDISSIQLQIDDSHSSAMPSSEHFDRRKHKVGSLIQRLKKPLEKNNDTFSSELNKRPGRKFVLPVRSVHSSRVIKPNKRFRDVDLYSSGSEINNGKSVKKIKLVAEEFSDDSSNSWIGKRTDGGLSDGESGSGYWSSSVSTASSSVNDEDMSVRAKGKVILRKAKLKVGPDPPAVKGPFSSGFDDFVPHEVVCSVCDSVRYYKNVKHARKFGIYSCETCKKFITKMISSRSKEKLLCTEGNDKCELSPYVLDPVTGERSHNNRCQACWLRMCLHCYGMPDTLMSRLSQRLPFILEKSVTLLKPKNSDNQQMKYRHRYFQSINPRVNQKDAVEKQILAKNIRRKAEAIVRKGRKPKLDISITKRNLQPGVISNKIRNKNKFSNKDINAKRKGDNEGSNNGEINAKRKRMRDKGKREDKLTRLNLKGPRVKHVCRSASLVLGQPVATFTDTSPSKQKSSSPGKESRSKEDTSLVPLNKQTDKLPEPLSVKSAEQGPRIKQASENDSLQSGRGKTNLSKQLSTSELVEDNPLDGKARTLQDLSRQHYELVNGATLGKDVDLFSVDFWESYDPEEVCNTGFALIGYADSFKTKAICFICGSAGLDKLIHCASCCEPYHRFCVEGQGDSLGVSSEDWWVVDWVCARCTVCHGCGKGGGSQVACQKCHKSHHTDCLAADGLASRLHSADRPWVCLSCLCCKSCNNSEVYKFVGNMPLCKVCFKLRQKGNFCPLCQSCYDENDFDTKMMECERCKCWVHAKCEGLSNEKYEILSDLPESVEFICRSCCKMPPAPWWLAVEMAMKAGFLAVLKSLSKNRKVCDMLKWSPTKRPSVCDCASGMRKHASRMQELSEQSDTESSDMRVQNECQRDETMVVENQCLKILASDTKGSEENLVCDQKTESRILTLSDLRTKYHVRDCSVVMKSSELHLKLDSESISYQSTDEKPPQFSPHATSQSDSGIGSTDDELKSTNEHPCFCLGPENWNKTPPTLLTIKKKVNSNDYCSIDSFNKEMEEMITSIKGIELLKLYYQTLKDAFPWFNPNCSEVVDSSTRVAHKMDASKAIMNITEDKSSDNDIADVSITLKGMLDKNYDYYYNNENKSEDNRICLLCKYPGEGKPTEEGRLLYCGQNEWVHTNCALWSNEVFEEIDGSLQNVQSAISRSRHIRCFKCNKKGASIGCCNRSCPEAYHFGCARNNNCIFFEDKSLYCSNHKNDKNMSRELVTGSDFLVSRPVYVELDTKKKKYIAKHNINIMIGSLTIKSLGDFSSDLSDQECSIIPYNFQCSRLFWSSVEPWRLVQYNIKTKIIYTVSDESLENDKNFTIDHSSSDQCNKDATEIVSDEECQPYQAHNSDFASDVKDVIEYVLDIVSSKDEEETQASADLLPPELKEAIFEDLPHDLLDGISMQDIFPKLMTFDPSVLDIKPEKEIKNTSQKSRINKCSTLNNKKEIEPVSNVTHKIKCNDMKKGNSRNNFSFSRRNKNEDVRRVTKLEEKENASDWESTRIIQIDGAGDCSSESSDLGSPIGEEPHKRLFQSQTSRQCRILQVDGVGDSCTSSSDSESGSPRRAFWKLGQVDGAMDLDDSVPEENPVKCTRCHRTYRTAQSFERHLLTCNVDYILSCSESDSSEEDKASNSEVKLSEPEDTPSKQTINSSDVPVEKSDKNISTPKKDNTTLPQVFFDQKNVLNSSNVTSTLRTYAKNKVKSNEVTFNNNTCQTLVQQVINDSGQRSLIPIENCNVSSNNPSPPQNPRPKTIRAMYECGEKQISPLSPPLDNFLANRNVPIRTYGRKKKPASPSTVLSTVKTYQSEPLVEYPNAPPAPSTVIIQQVPAHSVVPSYIESVPQHQAPNNIQYQYITTLDKQQIPLTIQLQAPISIQPVMPTVLGTLIQPNGIEQLVVNTPGPTVDMLNQQPTNVYITNVNQPMYMGMETVVSNTIMSSSQFMSGMLSGSSYSATTTQVFQAAKPVLPQSYVVVNTQANPITETSTHNMYPTTNNTQPWCYNYQETYKVKERTTYQQVTRQIIQEGGNVNCLQTGNPNQQSIYLNKPIVKEVTVEKTHSIQKTGQMPSLPNMVHNGNPLLVDNKNSQEKFIRRGLKSILPDLKISEPKIVVQKQSNAKEPSASNEKSPIKYNSNHIENKSVNPKTEENLDNDKKIIIIQNNSQLSTNERYNRPVITKVKPNSNVKNSNLCVLKAIDSDDIFTLSSNELSNKNQVPSPKESVVKVQEDVKKSYPPNNIVKNKINVKLEKTKTTEVKRLPLKENKPVTNKTKNNNSIYKKNKSVKSLSKTNPKLVYEISSQDGISICSQDLTEAWQKIIESVQSARAAKGLPLLSQKPSLSHLRMLGLDNNSVKYLIEQLPGAVNCTNYKPTFHKNKLYGHSEQLPENPTGCARTEAYLKLRRKYDMFSWLASRHRQPPKLIVNSDTEIVNGISRRATSLNLPMAMRFRHLKETSKESVGVFRSDIHGRGLFCLRDIDSGEMVIEYAGEVIRAGLTDKREHYYTSKGIGCYMFRIDDHFVVDATMHGNAARFINHSCEPNCYSRVVDILGKKHILIFALRKIPQGEELTYDYKFPLEDDKITCHCLSRKCRKYLN